MHKKHSSTIGFQPSCTQGPLARNFGLKTGLEEVRRSILPIKMDVFMLFSFCKRQIWLESAKGTQNQTCSASGMPSRASSRNFGLKTGLEEVRRSILPVKMDVCMLFSFCKRQIWSESARRTQNQTFFASGMPSRASSLKFGAKNRARRGR